MQAMRTRSKEISTSSSEDHKYFTEPPKIEKDEKLFQEIIDDIKSADGILWDFHCTIFCTFKL